jgi:secondary thiamine-phosphate synthase enzyme
MASRLAAWDKGDLRKRQTAESRRTVKQVDEARNFSGYPQCHPQRRALSTAFSVPVEVASGAMRTQRFDCTTITTKVLDFVDITDDVEATVAACGISDGQVTVFSESSSCALVVNERESGLIEDIRKTVDRLDSAGSRSDGHLIGSNSVVLPAVQGRLRLGTWQRLLLVELEKPDTRRIVVQILGE